MVWLRPAASCAVYSPSDSSAAARWMVRRSAWVTDGQGLSPKRSRTAAVVPMRRAARRGFAGLQGQLAERAHAAGEAFEVIDAAVVKYRGG